MQFVPLPIDEVRCLRRQEAPRCHFVHVGLASGGDRRLCGDEFLCRYFRFRPDSDIRSLYPRTTPFRLHLVGNRNERPHVRIGGFRRRSLLRLDQAGRLRGVGRHQCPVEILAYGYQGQGAAPSTSP